MVARPYRAAAPNGTGLRPSLTTQPRRTPVMQARAAYRALVCRSRELRQLVDVAGVVLDDQRRLEALHQSLDAIDRRQRLGAVVVEPRHAVALIVLTEV